MSNLLRSWDWTLNSRATQIGGTSIVLYAAPAVEDVSELVRIKKANGIISNSNFCRASELDGHHRNTYIEAGTHSIACSRPERLDNLDLLDVIDSTGAQHRENRHVLIDFATRVNGCLQESGYVKAAFKERLEEFQELARFELFYALLSMSIFREITGTQWLVALDRKEKTA